MHSAAKSWLMSSCKCEPWDKKCLIREANTEMHLVNQGFLHTGAPPCEHEVKVASAL